jgi:RimJ/RimL family protein N-acetyltransferase
VLPSINYNISLLSQRLRLVPVLKSHAEAMFTVLSDEKLHEFTGGTPPESIAAMENWFSALESRKSGSGDELWLTWILFTKEGHTAIGYVQATVKDSHTDIAWVVGSQWQRLGYASEASAALTSWLIARHLNMITAHVHSDHISSQMVAKAAGLHNSGRIDDGEEVWLYEKE